MVKFAEAEKRRGGDGVDRRFGPAMMLERPKISRGMWELLKGHIMRERRLKKEEQEASAQEERMRKEIENRKKQHAMTLEETREKIQQMEVDLNDLKKQKHQLFQDLKSVLNSEDTLRKKQQQQHQQQQQNYMKENELMAMQPFPPHGTVTLLGGHPQMLFQSPLVQGRPPVQTLYKVGQPPGLMPSGVPMKRSRTPSPPSGPAAGYQTIPFGYKNMPGQPSNIVSVTLPTSKAPSSNMYVTDPGPYYHTSSQSALNSSGQYSSISQGAYLASSAAGGGVSISSASSAPSVRDSVYITGRGGPHMSLHQSLDHKGKGITVVNSYPRQPDNADKYYQGLRTHHMHPGVLPVQQPQPGSIKSGSITAGYPVRAPPPQSSSMPPSATSAPPHSYINQPPSYSRSYY